MAPTPFDLPAYLSSLSLSEREELSRTPESYNVPSKRDVESLPILSPIDTFKALTARNVVPTHSIDPAAGGVDPSDINMKGIQAIFALIGASFVLGAIWFFFWAKNGGFQFRKGDWDEYKSTVLRRKGPNGTTLSNATKSTRLGGGSVVGQGYSDADGSYTTETMTDLSSEAPIIKEKQSQRQQKKETAKDRKIREAKEAQWEGGHDNDVRAYRHEKVARVGGLNKSSDAQHFGTDYTESDRSDVSSNRQHHNPQPNQYRSSSRQHSPDKRQSRRDFSYGQDTSFSAEPTSYQAPPPEPVRPPRYHSPTKGPAGPRPNRQSVPGSYVSPSEVSDVQSQYTKSYHHPIPGLSSQAKPKGGYRRDRSDSLDD